VSTVTLRPLRESDLPYFDLWADPETDVFNFFGHRTPRRARAAFTENGLLSPEQGMLLVVDDAGQVVGDVGWHVEEYGPGVQSRAYNIGIRLLPERRGQGMGGPAQRMLADYLFATYLVNRVEAFTDVENRPEQRALEKAGFTREGILRGSQWRDGSWHDLVSYSRLRSD
jgi:RimJ/RimL family protein N-acetyltransferase